MKKFSEKDKLDIFDLLLIMQLLRAPGGCKWDGEQTHQSIRQNLIEECYELVEAIDLEDDELLKEELGDVLLQVVFHSEMAKEESKFDFSDVVNDIARKLIVRHPHVFSDVKADTTEEILTNWDKIKKETKGQKSKKEVLSSVSKSLPSLMRHQKVVKKSEILKTSDINDLLKDAGVLSVDTTENGIGKAMSALVALCLSKGYDAEKLLGDYTESLIDATKN